MSRFKSFVSFAVVMLLAAVTGVSAAPQQEQQQAAAEAKPELTGEWIMSMEMGDATLTIKQEEAAKFTGVLDSPQGALDIEGEIEGNDIVFWGYVEDFSINFYATVEENKKMNGTLEAGGGEFVVDFTAVRKEKGWM